MLLSKVLSELIHPLAACVVLVRDEGIGYVVAGVIRIACRRMPGGWPMMGSSARQ